MKWGGHYRQRFRINRRCLMCCELFETTRTDAETCSPKCRKAKSRAINGDMEMEKVRQELRKITRGEAPDSP